MNVRLRAVAPLAAVASLALVLAACGGSDKSAESKPSAGASTSSSACDIKSGSQSDSVKATGSFGKATSVKIDGTLKATEIQRTVATKGTGAVPSDAATINVHLTVFDGTGKRLGDQDAPVTLDGTLPTGFKAAFECAAYGSRTVVTGPATDFYTASSMPSVVKATDSLIIVSDIVSKYKAPAPGAWKTQVPTVTFDSTGKPTLKLNGKPIKDWSMKVLRQGTGTVVKTGDNVTVNYQGTNWNTGQIFDQSYGKAPATFNTNQVVPGFGGALVGQKVGTRLVVTIPPALGYGATKTADAPLGGQTLVFVIEIIKTASN